MDLMHALGAGEILGRLGAATLIGCAIGLNRDMQGKPAGVRTHSLVGLGASFLTIVGLQLAASHSPSDLGAVSRVLQGIITGIGFLGAGVILRDDQRHSVHGLTTAASIWLMSCFGMACGLGEWIAASLAALLTLAVLVFGGPFEQAIHRRFRPHSSQLDTSEVSTDKR